MALPYTATTTGKGVVEITLLFLLQGVSAAGWGMVFWAAGAL